MGVPSLPEQETNLKLSEIGMIDCSVSGAVVNNQSDVCSSENFFLFIKLGNKNRRKLAA